MKKIYMLLAIGLSVITAAGAFAPVHAAGMYDDDGNYIEVEEYDPYEDDEDDAEADYYAAFSTSWFDQHPGRDEYTITTATQLQGLADLVNESHYDSVSASVKYEDFEGKTIKLGRDIRLNSDFTPIGNSEDVSFKGTFDGNGHTISNVNLNENGGYAGLFGYLDGTVKNLQLEGKIKSSGPVCGAFAGYLSENGVIKNCTSRIEVTGKSKTGGIAGFNDGGRITGCVNEGKVSGTMKVGGVVGENWGSVIKSGNRGDVKSSVRGATTYGTGGVCGRSVSKSSSIDRCFNTGSISSGTEGSGGICGYMNAKGSRIISSYNTGSIKVTNNNVLNTDSIRGFAGGIVGIAGAKGVIISDCYNAGTIDNSDISGGIIGKYFNESKNRHEPYIVNNFYLGSSGVRGIGSDNSDKPQNFREGTEKIAQSTLINGAAKLGSEYTEDAQSYYGAGGYPVLKWQTKLGKVENTRLSCISEDMQNTYDSFIEKNPPSERADWSVMMFFNYSAFTSQAIGDFNEK